MNPLANLKDIQGLDHISIWPLAMGWLILLAASLVGIVSVFVIHTARRRQKRRWEYAQLKRLEEMESESDPQVVQAMATELERLMRRIAIHRFSREECAHMNGAEWLDWMSSKDPKQFDWRKTSRLLIEAPFQPPGALIDADFFRKTIQAAKGWIK
jgi:hypothetical protein